MGETIYKNIFHTIAGTEREFHISFFPLLDYSNL